MPQLVCVRPPIMPCSHGVASEMALTGRSMSGQEAAALGLVARCFDSRELMMGHVMRVSLPFQAWLQGG